MGCYSCVHIGVLYPAATPATTPPVHYSGHSFPDARRRGDLNELPLRRQAVLTLGEQSKTQSVVGHLNLEHCVKFVATCFGKNEFTEKLKTLNKSLFCAARDVQAKETSSPSCRGEPARVPPARRRNHAGTAGSNRRFRL